MIIQKNEGDSHFFSNGEVSLEVFTNEHCSWIQMLNSEGKMITFSLTNEDSEEGGNMASELEFVFSDMSINLWTKNKTKPNEEEE